MSSADAAKQLIASAVAPGAPVVDDRFVDSDDEDSGGSSGTSAGAGVPAGAAQAGAAISKPGFIGAAARLALAAGVRPALTAVAAAAQRAVFQTAAGTAVSSCQLAPAATIASPPARHWDASEPLYKLLRRGDPVSAQWAEDGEWYRAVITSVTHGGFPNAAYGLRYERYGNEESEVPVDRIQLLPGVDYASLQEAGPFPHSGGAAAVSTSSQGAAATQPQQQRARYAPGSFLDRLHKQAAAREGRTVTEVTAAAAHEAALLASRVAALAAELRSLLTGAEPLVAVSAHAGAGTTAGAAAQPPVASPAVVRFCAGMAELLPDDRVEGETHTGRGAGEDGRGIFRTPGQHAAADAGATSAAASDSRPLCKVHASAAMTVIAADAEAVRLRAATEAAAGVAAGFGLGASSTAPASVRLQRIVLALLSGVPAAPLAAQSVVMGAAPPPPAGPCRSGDTCRFKHVAPLTLCAALLRVMQEVADTSASLGERASAGNERTEVAPSAQPVSGNAAATRPLVDNTRHPPGAAQALPSTAAPAPAAVAVERPAAVAPAAPAPAFRLEEEGGTGGLAMPGQSNPLAQAVLLSRMVVPAQAASQFPQNPRQPSAAGVMEAGGGESTGPRAVEAPAGGSSWRDRMAARLAAKK